MGTHLSLFGLAVLFAGNIAWSGEEMKISPGVSAATNVFGRIAQPFEEHTGIKLVWTSKDPKGHGGDQVFIDVDQGTAEGGASGGVWEDWLHLMEEKGYKPLHLSEIKNRVIGIDRIQFMTYKAGPKKLSESDLKGVLTGKITNWKQVGGEDRAVVLLIPEKQPNTLKFIEERFLKTHVAKEKSLFAPKSMSNDDFVKLAGSTPGVITFGPTNLVSSEVNVPEQPTVGRPITFIWRGAPTEHITKLLDFIQHEGPKYGVVK